ncbi:Ig domain-containing protein [Schlesneria paludicola]|uniref:Ig domain-containing protein n=1 Tax=Schlesneria paludicola TaxID=360056 RepID=UPI00029AB776|nr:Ig domain-containing protein [Schlesneria paludicola]
MQRRQQYLLGGLIAVVLIWQGSGWVASAIFGPFETRREELTRLQQAVADKGDKLLSLARARKLLKEWQAISLPPDDLAKSKKPSARDAQRLYMQWLTDLAQLCGFEELKVTTSGQTQKGNVYIAVVVKLDAEAKYDQLVRFLDLFYRTELMHRVTSLTISNKVFEGDPALKISLDAEGLALIAAPSRRTIFPQTVLDADISDSDTTLEVVSSTGFPKEPGFRVQVLNEFLKVVEMNGNRWTVERGVERTVPSAAAEGTTIDLVRMKPEQSERTLEEFRALIASNIFVKPPPAYRMKLMASGEKVLTRGKSLDFTIGVSGYDTSQGKPEFAVVGTAPPGLKLDRFGKVSWKPADDIPAGRYELKFEVRHPSAPQGQMAETQAIRLRDPKTPPKLVTDQTPKVYLNREWKFQPELTKSDDNPSTYTWKLGDRAPAGLAINAKTGELTWTPGDEIAIGELPVAMIISDNDSPPQATTLTLKLNVQDDAAQFTRLTGIFALGDNKRALLTDQSTDRKTELHEGDAFAISDLQGTIKQIDRKFLIMTLGQREIRWDMGQSLREAQARLKGN